MEMPFYVTFLIITIIALFFIVNKRVMHGKLSNEALIYPFLCCAIFTFLLNYNKDIFSDSLDYAQYFERLQNWTFMQAVNDSTVYAVAYMPGFRILSWLISQTFSNVHFYFAIISTIIFTLVSIGVVKILRAPYGIIAIISYTMYPYFSSYTALGIRQGLALGVMFLVIASILKREKYKSLWWIFISIMFHNTAAVLLLLYVAAFFNFKNIFKLRNAIIAWVITLILSIADIFNILINSIIDASSLDNRYQVYFNNGTDYIIGFRPDFVIFSLFPVIIYSLFRKKISDVNVHQLIVFYILMNCLMNLFSFMPFYDRFAAYSWMLIPLIIVSIAKDLKNKHVGMYGFGLLIFLPIVNFVLFIVYNSKWYFSTL